MTHWNSLSLSEIVSIFVWKIIFVVRNLKINIKDTRTQLELAQKKEVIIDVKCLLIVEPYDRIKLLCHA